MTGEVHMTTKSTKTKNDTQIEFDVNELRQAILNGSPGAAFHRATRKASDSEASAILFQTINKMPDKEWSMYNDWMVDAALGGICDFLQEKGIKITGKYESVVF